MTNTPSHPTPLPRRSPTGFTLIELLTVIGIIVVLISMLFVAVKYARIAGAKARTKAQLATLQGMLGQLDSSNHLSQSPPTWLWYTQPAGSDPTINPKYVVFDDRTIPTSYSVNAVTTVNADFWRYPFGIPGVPVTPPYTTPPYIDSLDSPGDVGNDTGPGSQQDIQRNASFAVLNTQLAMQLLAADPANRAALDKLSADSKMLPTWEGGSPLQATQYTAANSVDYVGLLPENNSVTPAFVSPSPNYLAGMHVSYSSNGTTSFFVCSPTAMTTPAVPDAVPPIPGATNASTTGWVDETAYPHGAPLLLDGWGNPIIFVPASGLHVKLLNGQGSYLSADPPGVTSTSTNSQEYIIVSPEGHVTNQGSSNPYCDRPGRPFFASAGPDGDFTKGDDNIYSFDQ